MEQRKPGIEIDIGDYTEFIPCDGGGAVTFDFSLEKRRNMLDRGYVYIITDGYAVKIGISNDEPAQRINSVQTGNPRHLETLQVIECYGPRRCEQAIHEFFDDYRILGEWFDLLPLFGISPSLENETALLKKEIKRLKKELRQLKSENNRWRNARYGDGSKYCSECGHPLIPWWTELSEVDA